MTKADVLCWSSNTSLELIVLSPAAHCMIMIRPMQVSASDRKALYIVSICIQYTAKGCGVSFLQCRMVGFRLRS